MKRVGDFSLGGYWGVRKITSSTKYLLMGVTVSGEQ